MVYICHYAAPPSNTPKIFTMTRTRMTKSPKPMVMRSKSCCWRRSWPKLSVATAWHSQDMRRPVLTNMPNLRAQIWPRGTRSCKIQSDLQSGSTPTLKITCRQVEGQHLGTSRLPRRACRPVEGQHLGTSRLPRRACRRVEGQHLGKSRLPRRACRPVEGQPLGRRPAVLETPPWRPHWI